MKKLTPYRLVMALNAFMTVAFFIAGVYVMIVGKYLPPLATAAPCWLIAAMGFVDYLCHPAYWIRNPKRLEVKCSNCKNIVDLYDYKQLRYCPYCGSQILESREIIEEE